MFNMQCEQAGFVVMRSANGLDMNFLSQFLSVLACKRRLEIVLAFLICSTLCATSDSRGQTAHIIITNEGSRLASVSTNNSNSLLERGIALFEQGDREEAIENFSEAIRLHPNCETAYAWRGSAYFLKRDFDAAVVDFRKQISLNATNASAHLNLAGVYHAKRDFDLAMYEAGQAVKLDPKDMKARLRRGYYYCRERKYKEAIADFNEAIRLNPTNAEAYNEIAWVRATCPDESFRDGSEAVKFGTKACELTRWENEEDIDALAAAYAEIGDFQKAVVYERRAIEVEEAFHKYKDGIIDKLRADESMSVNELRTRWQADMKRRLSFYERKQPSREEWKE